MIKAITTANPFSSEKVNPILMKELSQGLRTNAFTWAFILTIILQSIIIAFQIGMEAGGAVGTGVFWAVLCVPFCIMLPIRALDAINSEVRQNTLEMLYLSRLSARRIVMGKYLSHLIQMLLLASANLPFIVLRYFAGEIQIFNELLAFLIIIMASMILIAFAIYISSFASRNRVAHYGRAALASIGFCCATGPIVAVVIALALNELGSGISAWNIVLCVPAFIIFGVQFVVMSAAQIAPEAENLIPAKRLPPLLAIVFGLAFIPLSQAALPLFAAGFCVSLSGLDALIGRSLSSRHAFRPLPRLRRFEVAFMPALASHLAWLVGTLCCATTLFVIAALISDGNLNGWMMMGVCVAFFLSMTLIMGLIYTMLRRSGRSMALMAMLALLLLPMAYGLVLSLALPECIPSFSERDGEHVLCACIALSCALWIPIALAQLMQQIFRTLNYLAALLISFITGIFIMLLQSVFSMSGYFSGEGRREVFCIGPFDPFMAIDSGSGMFDFLTSSLIPLVGLLVGIIYLSLRAVDSLQVFHAVRAPKIEPLRVGKSPS